MNILRLYTFSFSLTDFHGKKVVITIDEEFHLAKAGRLKKIIGSGRALGLGLQSQQTWWARSLETWVVVEAGAHLHSGGPPTKCPSRRGTFHLRYGQPWSPRRRDTPASFPLLHLPNSSAGSHDTISCSDKRQSIIFWNDVISLLVIFLNVCQKISATEVFRGLDKFETQWFFNLIS